MRRIFFSTLLIFLILVGSSCSNQTNTTTNHGSPNYNYDEEIPAENLVESVVNEVYSSVVAVNSYQNGTLYSSGSGVFFASDDDLNLTYILTCYHVIAAGNCYEITLTDNTTYACELVGGDIAKDIAILSVQGLNFNCVKIPAQNTLRLGSMVVVIGNPLGTLPGSISVGYVSYLKREIYSADYRKMQLIQTDTAINSGNSGGGMFDTKGRLVGIINAKYAAEGVEGLGFAISISEALQVADSIFATASYDQANNTWTKGYVIGAWELGFTVADISIFPTFSYLGITELSTNPNTSGYNEFSLGDQIIKVTVTTDTKSYQLAVDSAQAFYLSLYQLDLELDNSLTFLINRNGKSHEITFPLTQFIPQ